ncbi:PMSR-domain-containing protein [Ascobolus immersus RN42]|uniref:peptide-methionine (S)-S-oxide reductase n=1 Tax=Ascobolus immersus RN42 TaxID=1160509 RepID=A0A3N4I448_ASCIM|nr:PMSR-domain-containing protein [Ascobolus immersus RN42]
MIPNFLSRIITPLTSTKMGVTPSHTGITGSPITLPANHQKAIFAAGCFWGVEHIFRKHFPGLHSLRVGYIGGSTTSPTYRAVCSGSTGHAEAVLLVYDESKTPYRELVEFFYRMHDPTTANRQGPDVGTQYRSAIYYTSEEQRKTAEEVTRGKASKWWAPQGSVKTEVVEAGEWWDAEDYHQRYLDNNPGGYECPSHFVRNFQ